MSEMLPEGEDPGLEARKYFSPAQAAFASGNHAAIVEVDPETGIVTILKYVAVHDCGRGSTLVKMRTVDPWPVNREKATDGRLRSAAASGTTVASATASGACPFRYRT